MKMNISGLVSPTKEVHGVTVRGLNFADLSAQWQSNGVRLMEAFDEVMAKSKGSDDLMDVANSIIKYAPDLARAAFLSAVNDKGEKHLIGEEEELTLGEIWDTKMGIGKQMDFVIAIIDLTMNESDNLKKRLLAALDKPTIQKMLSEKAATVK